jgi:hypothetical protein
MTKLLVSCTLAAVTFGAAQTLKAADEPCPRRNATLHGTYMVHGSGSVSGIGPILSNGTITSDATDPGTVFAGSAVRFRTD